MQWGGAITGSRRVTDAHNGGETTQDALTYTLDGSGYIWRPWFATNRLQFNFQETWTEFNREDGTGEQTTQAELISGIGRITLAPVSRFPAEAFLEIFDTRVETDSVGVALDDINTQRRERVGFIQHYQTVSGQSNYAAEAVRTRTYSNDDAFEETEDYWLFGANRFDTQSLNYRANQRDTVRDQPDAESTEKQNLLTVHHDYRPGDTFAMESAFNGTRDDERFDGVHTRDEIASAASFVTWRPDDSKWTVRGNLTKQRSDRFTEFDDAAFAEPAPEPDGEETLAPGSSTVETYSAFAGATYDFNDEWQFSGDSGVSQTRSSEGPDTEQRFQNATLSFNATPRQLTLNVRYSWNARAAVGNTDSSQTESVQTGSLTLGHGLDRAVAGDGGRTTTLSLSQSATRFGDSQGADLLEMRHVASAAVAWSRSSSSSRLQATLTDSRTTGVDPVGQPDSAETAEESQDDEVDLIVQTISLDGNRQMRATRSSALDGAFSTGQTRVYDKGAESRFTFAHVSGGYTYHHVFNVDRLLFRSRLEYEMHQSETSAGDADDDQEEQQERLSWDSRLDYIIGLLSFAIRRTVFIVQGDYTRITVVSVTRRF